MSIEDWVVFLQEWDTQAWPVITRMGEELKSDNLGDRHLYAALKRRTCGYPPASLPQISEVETKLNCILPPSYKSFLRASNGWTITQNYGWSTCLSGTQNIGLFSDLHPAIYKRWIDNEWEEPSDEEYFLYSSADGCYEFPSIRLRHLPASLAVSEENMRTIFVINPNIVAPDGEWEAWDLSDKTGEVYRYRSFAELMMHLREINLIELQQFLWDIKPGRVR